MTGLQPRYLTSLFLVLLASSILAGQTAAAPSSNASAYEQRRGQPPSDPASHPVRGGYLPSSLMDAVVSDPARYHVRPAPPGYRWVHVGHDLLLIQERSGLIVDLVEGGYD